MHLVRVIDEDSVRPGEHPLPPRVEELPVLVEHDERVLPAAEDVDPIAGIDRDSRHLGERPAFGKAFPAFRHLELQTVVSLRHRCASADPLDVEPHYATSDTAQPKAISHYGVRTNIDAPAVRRSDWRSVI